MGARANDVLFELKLTPPVRQDYTVGRPRLMTGFQDPAVKLIAIRAPAGFGKTTLMNQLQEMLVERGVSCVWLTLDAADNDPAGFSSALVAAVGRAASNKGSARVSTVADDARAGFLDLLMASSSELTLLLDDVHLIESEMARRILQMLVFNSPPTVRLVMAGRSIPRFGQSKLRLQGGVVDIEADELRFKLDEASAFFSRQLPDPLPTNELTELHWSTEGWAAALQLACLSMRHTGMKNSSRRLAALQTGVAEYLAEDVLERESEEVRRFLTETSILRVLTGDLCDAVTGREGGEAMLAYLERAGVFVLPTGSDRGRAWYQYHAMFAEFLSNQLRLDKPQMVLQLHARASDWFAEQAMIGEAVDHARRAGEEDRALSLLDGVAMDHIWSGRLRTVLDWKADLTNEQAVRYEHLFSAYLWAEGFVGDAKAAQGRLSAFATSPYAAAASDRLRDVTIAMPLMIAGAEQDFDRVHRDGPVALAALSDLESFEASTLANCLGYAHLAMGRSDLAKDAHAIGKLACRRGGPTYNFAYNAMLEAQLLVEDERLDEAIAVLRVGYEQAKLNGSGLSQSAAITASFLAELYYEAGDFDGAEALLKHHRPMIAEAIPDCVIVGYLTAFRLEVARGTLLEAEAVLAEAETIGVRRKSPQILRFVQWHRALLAALRGESERALRLSALQQAEDAQRESMVISPVEGQIKDLIGLRISLLIEAPVDLRSIETAITHSAMRGGHRRRQRLDILFAVALAQQGQHARAQTTLAVTLKRGLCNGFVGAFLDEGRLARSLLQEARGSLDYAHPSRAIRCFDSHFGIGVDRATSSVNAQLAKSALTTREADILTILEKGLTNREIARALDLTESTVKWHLHNIFEKLGVANRTEAVFYLRPR